MNLVMSVYQSAIQFVNQGKVYLEYGRNYPYHGQVRTSSATPSWPSPISRKAF